MTATEVLRHRLNLSELINPWTWLLQVAWNKMQRPLCLPRRHAHWERETMLMAFGSGRSKRCGTCNRLVLKKQYRSRDE